MSYLITFSPLQSILMLTELTHTMFFDDKARRAIPFMCSLICPRALLTLFLLLECPSPSSFLPIKHYHLLKKPRILFRIHLYLLPVCSQQVALPVLWLFRKWPCVTLNHKCFPLLYEWALSYDLCFHHGLRIGLKSDGWLDLNEEMCCGLGDAARWLFLEFGNQWVILFLWWTLSCTI